ncbi:uncharacterized protein [Pyrus communis]|uniref:uncharacterized protein n=1 Tax=Pyrus communis TaxID=23211 RepID=UPI0035BEE866
MTLHANNDALMCKIFAMMLQGKVQGWFHTLPPCLIQNFSELSLVFTKEYLSYRLIKKKFDHLFNIKKDLKKSLRIFVKRFKVEKAKIVRCDDNIACSAFRNGLPADHQLFGELIIGENLSLANFYALHEQLCRAAESTQKKVNDKPLNIKSKPGDKRRDRSLAKGGTSPKTYTKFLVPISQILRDLKDKPWFKPPPPLRGDTSKMDQTKYYAFHRGPGYTSNDCTIWKRYLKKFVNEGKCDQYVDIPVARQGEKQMPVSNPQPRQSESTESLSNLSIWGPPITLRRRRSSKRDLLIRFKP